MKSDEQWEMMMKQFVAPFAGAWIEISVVEIWRSLRIVAPFAGAWIEILKHLLTSLLIHVAPFAGAWIEIQYVPDWTKPGAGRSLRGSVD